MQYIHKPALAVMSGKSVTTIDRAIAAGAIHVEKIGGRVLIPLDEARRWAASQIVTLAATSEILSVVRP